MKKKPKNQENIIITLDAQQMIRDIEAKYGKKPIVSEKGKKAKEDILKNGSIWERIPQE